MDVEKHLSTNTGYFERCFIVYWRVAMTMTKEYISSKDYAAKYNLHPRTVQKWCAEGKIEGAYKFGTSWAVPDKEPRPKDRRYKNGKWVGYRKRERKNVHNT